MINEVVKKQDDTLADLEQYVANKKQYDVANTNLISEILSENNNVVHVTCREVWEIFCFLFHEVWEIFFILLNIKFIILLLFLFFENKK